MWALKKKNGLRNCIKNRRNLFNTDKAIAASVNLRKAGRVEDILVRQLRNINFIDAIISILTLQNTLLVVMGSADRQDMTVLASISSAVGLAAILFLTIKNMIKKY